MPRLKLNPQWGETPQSLLQRTYSPELNAAEPLIRWLKESLDDNICWEEMGRLVRSFNGLVASLSHRREEVLRRCVPQTLGISSG